MHVKNKFNYGTILLSIIVIGLVLSITFIIEVNSNILVYEENFSIIVLPDTQHYPEKYPWIFDNQTEWIVQNIEQLNIVFVSHLGDIVEHWNNTPEWENANRSMSKLDDVVSWGVLPGNHDGFNGNFANYNKYFGYDRFKDESWYGGAYQKNNTNSFQLFSSGEEDYLIFHLQQSPNDDVLAWVNTTIDEYSNRWVIISTHRYMVGHGTNERRSKKV